MRRLFHNIAAEAERARRLVDALGFRVDDLRGRRVGVVRALHADSVGVRALVVATGIVRVRDSVIPASHVVAVDARRARVVVDGLD